MYIHFSKQLFVWSLALTALAAPGAHTMARYHNPLQSKSFGSPNYDAQLFNAIRSSQSATIKLLLRQGANIRARDEEGLTPLHHAAIIGHAAVIQELLDACITAKEKYAIVNAQDSEGATPLHWAAALYNMIAIQRLLDAGANLTIQTYPGETPMHWAEKFGHTEVMQYFQERIQQQLQPTLRNAVKIGDCAQVEALILSGVSVNFCDRLGRTPLHVAIEKNYLNIVQLLLNYGAPVGAKDHYGRTPLDLAIQKLTLVSKIIDESTKIVCMKTINTIIEMLLKKSNKF